MSRSNTNPAATPAPGAATIAEGLAAIPYEPLLPVEKTLIAGSLLLRFALLGVLLWASSTFFPVASLTK